MRRFREFLFIKMIQKAFFGDVTDVQQGLQELQIFFPRPIHGIIIGTQTIRPDMIECQALLCQRDHIRRKIHTDVLMAKASGRSLTERAR